MKLKKIILMFSLFFLAFSMKGQVTIGSTVKNNEGALLDLKENNNTSANATKGLLLPRVSLVSKTALYPMLNASDTADVDLKKVHTGLTVYNTTQCNGFCKFVYIWDGAEWIGYSQENCDVAFSQLPAYIHLPSGQDLRPMSGINTSLSWTPSSYSPSWTLSTSGSFASIPFTTNPITMENPLTTNPATLSLLPDAMTAEEITPVSASNPRNLFKTKENIITFSLSDDCETKVFTTKINQTNKALVIKDSNYTPVFENTSGYVPVWLDGTVTRVTTLYSNAIWRVRENVQGEAAFTGFSINNTSSETPVLTSGSEAYDGTYNYQDIYYTPLNDVSDKVHKESIKEIIFSDSEEPKRFSDVTINAIVCSGAYSPDPTPTSPAVGVFTDPRDNEKYTYRRFGTAGVWMLENMRAREYADGTSLPANPDPMKEAFSKKWAYPSPDGEMAVNPYYFDRDHSIGLMYTWYAATNGENRATSNQGQGTDTEGPTSFIRGICPTGWHLPSDREWNELEKELYNNAELYSYVDKSLLNPQTWDSTWDTTAGDRGSSVAYAGHAAVMKSMCALTKLNTYGSLFYTRGLSYIKDEGGFSASLVGEIYSDGTAGSGASFFWTSSVSSRGAYYDSAYMRKMDYRTSTVYRGGYTDYFYGSVRCKRDN